MQIVNMNLRHFETIEEFNDMLGVETLHPLVSVVDLSKARPMEHMRHTNGFYSVMLKDEKFCDVVYGRSHYDYDKGTVVCTSPGQLVGIEPLAPPVGMSQEAAREKFQPLGWGLFFAPELMRGTSLAQHIKEYSFFEYQANEALHLSERERETFLHYLHEIEAELNHTIDRLTRRLIASNVEILLDHCLRFYERQFITREFINSDLLSRFEQLLKQYFAGRKPQQDGLPTVRYCASELCLSPNYFSDLIKKETGRSAQEHIKQFTLGIVKQRLSNLDLTITEVAWQTGFQYPQHLTRFFKKETGQTPAQWRELMVG